MTLGLRRARLGAGGRPDEPVRRSSLNLHRALGALVEVAPPRGID
jgi:hypothetical protein